MGLFQFLERRHEQFRNETPAEFSEVTFFHDYPLRAVNAACIREGSLRPGSDSRPELKSTPSGTQAADGFFDIFRSEPAGQQPGAGSVQAAQPFGADPFSAAASGHPRVKQEHSG